MPDTVPWSRWLGCTPHLRSAEREAAHLKDVADEAGARQRLRS